MSKQIDPYETRLHPGNAYWMAKISKLIYACKAGSKHPDEALILSQLKDEDSGFLSVVGEDKNTAQAALIEHKDFLCMVFRGTDELGDWLDNINAFPVKVLFGDFHRGFWGSVNDVWDKINGRYEECRGERKRPLFITGHSLGGAMATIAASRLIHDDKPFTSVYTFGQPRAMSRETAQFFSVEDKGRCHRFLNNEDIVTRVPSRLMGYGHVGNCLYIDRAWV